VFPIYFNEALGHSKPIVGTLFLARSLSMAVAFYLVGKTIFWHFRIYPLVISQIVCAAMMVAMIPLKSQLPLALNFVVVGAVAAFSYSTAIFHGVSGAREKARRVGAHEAILGTSTVTGSILAGWAYQEVSISAVLIGCAGVCLFAAAAQTLGAFLFRRAMA